MKGVCRSINSYVASILTDWLRTALLQTRQSFTFETVMSSADKLDTFRRAKQAGFRTYLYYIATDDPAINIERVSYRTLTGGADDLPEWFTTNILDKISPQNDL